MAAETDATGPARTYLVGGAVRDELLGLDVVERDWVVTGATPDDLLSRGYRQVGASFPVFLHPDTGEEYALARTERKQGRGYHGFTVAFDPHITIEQDLERRDLTINAMARDPEGGLVDPFGGREDLDKRILRHVSPAFSEDPLRVLRVARFAARFHDLGFRIHPDTLELMRHIAAVGELDHLVPERAWTEIRRAMGSKRPSVFVQVLRDCDALSHLLPEVDCLFGIPQPERYHPEVDTGVHLMMALDQAAKLSDDEDVRVAVLFHDLGKGVTPADQLPSHRGHEETGLPLVEAVCARYRVPNHTRRLALQVCAHHLDCHRLLAARPKTVFRLLERLDALRQPDIEPFLAACEADYLGRKGLDQRPYPQAERLRAALAAALAVRATDLRQRPEGRVLEGKALGEALRRARIEAIGELAVDPGE
ncbi:MAG: multifunctional CCA addition/repair protein [Xanthomonadales bacterium]|jgi:tRNA nucleotidyltransferase (CCA-adding enzyme)|nr:multifunctional CCA addition/repair protein [Xanthomonadales bacterium]